MLNESRSSDLDLSRRIEQFLETRRIVNDLSAASKKIRIESKIRVNRSPWTFNSVVLCDGIVFQRKPFSPLSGDLDTGAVDWREVKKAQAEFAEKVLERHDERCRLVEADLANGDRSVLAGRPLVGKLKRHRIAVSAVLGAGAILVLAGLFFFWKHSQPGKPVSPPRRVSSPVVASPVPPASPEPPAEAPKEPVPAAPRPPRPAQVPVRKQAIPAVPKPASQSASPKGPAISRIDPPIYVEGVLRYGDFPYVDTTTKFTEIPSSVAGVSCIRTAYGQRTANTGIAFDLSSKARVYVAHDRRIRKKPGWLENSFTLTGDSISVNGAAGEAELDLYIQEYPAGRVELGANTDWRKLTQKIRVVIPKEITMYIVCVAPE